MRLLADTNIAAPAVHALLADGHDVPYAAERPSDPGDAALLAEALRDQRILITKDHDIGVLVFRDRMTHAGVLLIDDLGDSESETQLLRQALKIKAAELSAGEFVRAGA